ncbi:MAG TPA: DUF418 domain-containing protein [Sphingomicrobium sp.]|nr:DUF418 domain-containing protein [Sphingomicrobium sp.]
MAETTVAPTSKRLESLDFFRGVALFGILIMNIVGMGLGAAYDNPTIAGGDTGINLWTWLVVNIGFEGTQRALFSILFGAGVILLTGRFESSAKADATDIFFRRNLLLIGFGLFNAWILLWDGDILYYYGIAALFLYAFRKLPGRKLLVIGVGALLLGAAWSAIDTQRLLNLHDEARVAEQVAPAARTAEQTKAIETWKEKSKTGPSKAEFAELRKKNTASYWSALKTRATLIKHHQSWWLYRFFFDIFGMMMIGMALFKLGVLTLETRARTYLAMLAGGYALGLTGNILEARWIMDHGFTKIAYTEASITYDISRLAMTMGHLGFLGLFLKSGILPWFRRSMAAVGRMALTNYLTHSLVALIVFVFLGYWGALERHQLYFIVFTVWAVQIVVSPIWLKYFHFGPVEWFWRALTYGYKPPFRKSDVGPPAGAIPVPA